MNVQIKILKNLINKNFKKKIKFVLYLIARKNYYNWIRIFAKNAIKNYVWSEFIFIFNLFFYFFDLLDIDSITIMIVKKEHTNQININNK